MGKRILIVGGVAGGASAAARLRRLDEQAEIIMFERGEHISYANCGLPYFVGGVITKRNNLFVQTPASMRKRFNIDVRVQNEVIRIYPKEKEVEVKDLVTGEVYREAYDYLILSPGASPFVPDIAGIKLPNVFTFRKFTDSDLVKRQIELAKPQSAVVIGGGFIGLEMAENLRKFGAAVTLVEMANQVMPPLDYEMAVFIHQELKRNGVNLCLKEKVVAIEGTNRAEAVVLASGSRIPAEMVIVAIGVRPEVHLAKEAGLAIGSTGGILVDEYLRTSDPFIYAIGDAIQVKDFVNGHDTHIPLAGPANKQGRLVADTIAGIPSKYKGTQGTAIVQVFDLVAASTGNNEKTLRKLGSEYLASYTHPASHATYYPGAVPMSIKLLFTPRDGKILGAQIVGSKGVDKRIDVLATAIRAGLTVFDLTELELAYAPPFSSAKDPVNMAGYVASNIVKGDMEIIHWHEIAGLNPEESVLVDVRTPREVEAGTIPGAINIPVDELRERLGELPRDKEIIVFCQVGLRAYIATRILRQHGFKRVKNLSGGWMTYRSAVLQ
ncbi:MAG: pyridine nucleotide-disulfide oxidoreductase family protein [Firmicutes bacterium]|nr:pyridine nucleotide-disulfide oxidoreductase family protein [Bacillota bacterium]